MLIVELQDDRKIQGLIGYLTLDFLNRRTFSDFFISAIKLQSLHSITTAIKSGHIHD